jgi:hypothetical protein
MDRTYPCYELPIATSKAAEEEACTPAKLENPQLGSNPRWTVGQLTTGYEIGVSRNQ